MTLSVKRARDFHALNTAHEHHTEDVAPRRAEAVSGTHEEEDMALLINSDCINCGMCEMECPNEAIAPGEDIFVIDPAKCTECIGHFEESQCVKVCLSDCIFPDPAHREIRAHA